MFYVNDRNGCKKNHKWNKNLVLCDKNMNDS